MIKLLKYGLEATTKLRHKHTGIESSTTRRWFYCSLKKQLIHHLPSALIQKMGKHTNLKNHKWGWWEGCGLCHIRSTNSHSPFLPSISRTGRHTTTSRLLATWMSLRPTLQMRSLNQRGTTSFWYRLLLHTEMESSQWSGFATSLRGEDWDKPMKDCCWACARDQFIWPNRQASLGVTTSLRLWRKGHCEAQISQHCLKAELNTCAKIQAEFPTSLDTSLTSISWTLIRKWHSLDTVISPPSESGREEIVSTRATMRWEISYSVLRVAWAAAPMPVSKSDRLWSAFLLAEVKVILSGGVEDQDPKSVWWLEKYQINLYDDLLVARCTGARRTLAWYHNIWDLMLGASCSLEVSEIVLTEWRNPEETEDVKASGSSKDVSNSDVSMESVRMESKPCSKLTTAWSRKESSHPGEFS